MPISLIARARAKLAAAFIPNWDDIPQPLLPESTAELLAEMHTVKVRIAAGESAQVVTRLEQLSASPLANADVWVHLGIANVLTGCNESAVEPLKRALAADPQCKIALRFLTAAQAELGCLSEALQSGLEYLRLNPSDCETLTNVAIVYCRQGSFEEGMRYFDRALQVDSTALNALSNMVMFSERGLARSDTDPVLSPRAEKILRRERKRLIALFESGILRLSDVPNLIALLHGSQEHFPTLCRLVDQYPLNESAGEDTARRYLLVYSRRGDAQRAVHAAAKRSINDEAIGGSRHTLANMKLAAGTERWAESWLAIRECHRAMQENNLSQYVPEWDGSPLGKRRLFVYQDQGYGDAILGLRLVRELVKRRIAFVLWVQPTIVGLVRTVPGCESALSQETCPNPSEHGCEVMISLFGLVSALALSPADIDCAFQVQADPVLLSAWHSRIASLPGRRIGVALMGNPKRYDDWVRSVSPKDIGALQSIRGQVSWVNLSVDKRNELDTWARCLSMTDYTSELTDFAQTAALVASLDAVIAIDCVVAHLALSLGKPTWVLAPTQLDWRWRIGDVSSPWWRDARVLQGELAGDWSSQIAKLANELETFITTETALLNRSKTDY